ncbi:MAG: hypothetical protein ACPGSD_09975 [Flavobacteriales bacterium]
MNKYKKVLYVIFTILLIYSCSNSSNDIEQKIINTSIINPLDKILGEKLLNDSTKEIRAGNFESLKNLTKKNIQEESLLYKLSEIKKGYYKLNQKKFYSNARLFSAILKVDSERVVNYRIESDFKIVDESYDTKAIYLLKGNFGYNNKFWKINSEIQLVKLDHYLNQLYVYKPNSKKFPLEAMELEVQKDYLNVVVNVITGCHICFNTFELKIDKNGTCISAIEISKQNSSVVLDKKTIEGIFMKGNY